MYILGIHDGHNCSATLTSGAEVIASIAEERITRKKNDVGYPRNAIEEVLRIGGVNPDQLAGVVIASLFMHKEEYLRSVEDWYRVGRKEQEEDMRKPTEYLKIVYDHRSRERIGAVTSHLGVDLDSVEFLEHHMAHIAAAYYMAPSSVDGKRVLGLTCDGSGDGISATVSLCQDNKIERISTTQRGASLGKIYSRVTYLLGMRPWEDEHKVMGLAAYIEPERCTEAIKVLEGLLKVEDGSLNFSQTTSLTTNYCYEYLREAFERVRFDIIAGSTQIFTERILEKWVRNCIQKTGLTDVVCGGGVFMNVKANMLISEIPNLKSLYVAPSCGDESLSLGACLHKYHQMRGDTHSRQGVSEDIYWGGEFNDGCVKKAIEDELQGAEYNIEWPENIDRLVAERLAAGDIVARFAGRMEWGARALGNRSILADPYDSAVVHEIGRIIKMRDFWMPFAPIILDSCADRYVIHYKHVNSDSMMFAFRAREDAYSDLKAATHMEDHTTRPQILRRRANPRLYHVLEHFLSLTGRGALLNTSFNLHGYPIVYKPVDALRVFKKSGLKHIALEKAFISKADI
jgi:carbamoyltransferase